MSPHKMNNIARAQTLAKVRSNKQPQGKRTTASAQPQALKAAHPTSRYTG